MIGRASEVRAKAKSSRSFSLIEVVIAVGIFAVAIVVILSLLPTLARTAAESADTLVAQSLPEMVRGELSRLATSGGFDALTNRLPTMAIPLSDGLALAGARDALRLHSLDYLPPPVAGQLPEAGRYFLVEAWRFAQPPLRFDPASPALAVYVRVSWPWNTPGGVVTPLSARSELTFVISLRQ